MKSLSDAINGFLQNMASIGVIENDSNRDGKITAVDL
jgi:hypothetical protein